MVSYYFVFGQSLRFAGEISQSDNDTLKHEKLFGPICFVSFGCLTSAVKSSHTVRTWFSSHFRRALRSQPREPAVVLSWRVNSESRVSTFAKVVSSVDEKVHNPKSIVSTSRASRPSNFFFV